MPSLYITPSGGLLTHQFIEALQQPTFNHPACAPETFALRGRKAPTPGELERTIGAAWELLVERWDAIERDLPGMDISTLRERWIRPLFSLLDFGLEYQRADLVLEVHGRPDHGLRFPISHLGIPSGAEGVRVPVHTVLPAEGSLDTRIEAGAGLRRLAPHDLLQRFLNLNHDSLWGMLTDGVHLRLLRDYHHTYTRGCVEFDLQGIFVGRDFAAFRALYRLCHSSRFLPLAVAPPAPPVQGERKPIVEEEDATPAEETAPEALTPLESFYQHALSTGVRVGEDLRGRVREAIETFANGFLQVTPGLLPALQSGEIPVAAFYDYLLHTIYRILFLLFAEQRGMFPGRGSLYMEEYSLTSLRALAERPAGEDSHPDLWERLKATFCLVEHGAPGMGIFGYNGALFNSDRTPILTPPSSPAPLPRMEERGVALRNDALLAAIRALTTVEREGVLQRISYADLSVEEMGSVYESLLDYTPRIAVAPETVEGREIAAGRFYLDPRGKERKTTGSYYTHPSLVNELIRSALLPVLEERLRLAVPGFDAEHPERLTAEQRQAAEEALLALKVVDPAAGSGAFLIAADNALGLRLAQICTGDLYPTEREVRRARRDVLARCLYAVDLNPMAVELCKLSLWINAVVEDQPLNFLDHHIKCGNSLVGTFRRLVAQGIPSEAYGGASGDDRALAKAFKSRNDQEVSGQLNVLRVIELRQPEDFQRWLELTCLAQEDPNLAEQRFLELQSQSEESAERLAFDLWTAAFFWPLQVEEDSRASAERLRDGIQARRVNHRQPEPPTTQDVYQVLATIRLVSKEMKAYAHRLRDQHRFFHWELEFPEVFGPGCPGGFDVVLGNPPWERIKLQEKEFFVVHAPEIASAPNAAARRRLIEALPKNNPAIWNLYQQALRSSECTAKFLRCSNRYPLTSSGDINTYSVFAETDRDLIAAGGRAGVIVPSGIATDFTNKDFFAELVETEQLICLYDFENRRGIFPGVHRSYKFCLLTLSRVSEETSPAGQRPAEFAFFLLAKEDLSDSERRFHLTAADFTLLNPNTRTCPVFRTRRDAELTRKLYRAAPVLVNETTGENPWGVTFLRMFDMANDSGLFRTREQLEADEFRLLGNRFVRGEEIWLPLYEGRMIHHYNHRPVSVGINTETQFRTGTSIDTTIEQYLNPSFTLMPRYWVSKPEIIERTAYSTVRASLIAFKDITSPTNERTYIGAIIPYSGVGNSLPLLFFNSNISSSQLGGLVANLASFCIDFVARQKIGGAHVNFYLLEQFPVLPPAQFSKEILYQIIPNVLELTYTAWDLCEFADEVWKECDDTYRNAIVQIWSENIGVTSGGHADAVRPKWAGPPEPEGFPHPPFKWDEERRLHLRAELDGLYAHLYGLHRDEFTYILDTFPIVRRKDETKYGEYRTKRLCLEAYDRLVGSDLIPPEARALQKESVIGEKTSIPVVKPPAPVPAAQPPNSLIEKAAQSVPQPKSKTRRSVSPEAERSAKPAPKAEVESVQIPLEDYGLYQCSVCGKMVMGFDRNNHEKDRHAGKTQKYNQIR